MSKIYWIVAGILSATFIAELRMIGVIIAAVLLGVVPMIIRMIREWQEERGR